MYRHRHVWMRFGLFRRPVLHYRTTSTSASQPVTPKDKEEGIRQLPMSILTSYLQRYTTPEDQIECSPCHASLARATAEQFPRFAGQAVSAMQGRFLRMLVRAMGAKRVLELGCFTGQSALWMMEGMLLGAGSSSPVQLVTCEIDAKRAQVAREWIDRAQLSKYIQLYEGPAQIMLEELAGTPPFDFIFLDANKSGYIQYLDTILKHGLLAEHGLIIADNVLFRGNAVRVAASQETANTSDNPDQISITDMQPNVRRAAQAMHAFNQYVVNDPRVEVIILPLFDGLSFIQHRTHSTTSQPAYVHA